MNIQTLEKFCDNHEIITHTYQKLAEMMNNPDFENMTTKGFAVHDKNHNMKLICYNDNLPITEKCFVFAHEVGHHVLQHLTNRKNNGNEIEADVFASVLMALNVYNEMRGAVSI